MKLSVVLSTRNEEENIARCLASVKNIADEIIIVDEESFDKTREIAKKMGAKVFVEPHEEIFHITKQKALNKATGKWVLQMDADEVVTPELEKNIREVLNGTYIYKKDRLFEKHQKLIEQRDGKIGKGGGEVVGYFIPRVNMFLGKPLIHGGVYPDGVIRLIKNGKARFPQKSVHEQITLDGEVSWLNGNLLHYDSPTFKKYLSRLNRYTDLKAKELEEENVKKNIWSFFLFTTIYPISTFCKLYFRHLGFLDGAQGFLWAFFSSTHYPISYFKYLTL